MQISLVSLGLFVFSALKTSIDQLHQKNAWRYASSSAVGVMPKQQFLGPDASEVTLPGLLYPGITDGPDSLEKIKAMAATGQGYALLGGDGTYFGVFIIESIDQTRSYFTQDGQPQKIEFTLTLKEIDDSDTHQIAVLKKSDIKQDNTATGNTKKTTNAQQKAAALKTVKS